MPTSSNFFWSLLKNSIPDLGLVSLPSLKPWIYNFLTPLEAAKSIIANKWLNSEWTPASLTRPSKCNAESFWRALSIAPFKFSFLKKVPSSISLFICLDGW